MLAFAVLAVIPSDVSAPLVRALEARPELCGAARCWLVDRGLDPETSLYDPGDLFHFAQSIPPTTRA